MSPIIDAVGTFVKKIEDIGQTFKHGLPGNIPSNINSYYDAVMNMRGRGIDDRLFLLENLVSLMAHLPSDSELAMKMQHKLMDILYKDLPHPPSSYLTNFPIAAPIIPAHLVDKKSESIQAPPVEFEIEPRSEASKPLLANQLYAEYAYRSNDGSNYNVLLPNMGRAGMPYARSVPAQIATSPSALPDPGLVFDTLLKRDKFEVHPGGISSLFFAFANLVIHSIFDTSHSDTGKNDASSYLDLSPLYGGGSGVLVRSVDEIRLKDGTGQIRPDTFGDGRILHMPPSTGALLILFNRNHNFIAKKILDMNERGTFSNPPPKDSKKCIAQDDEIFHKARLVNTGFFMQIILRDYVGAILGLTRDGLSWRLNPLETMRDESHSFSPVGEGNVVSIEFNQLYRWHATTSEPDAKWMENLIKTKISNKPYNQITKEDFLKAAHTSLAPPKEIKDWTIGDLVRGSDGRFADADLAKILQDATESPASAFKARGTPAYMRVVEVMGIEASRAWGTCTINEFRKFIGLKPYSSFSEWNSDKDIAATAEKLYGVIDNLEFYIGIQAEQPKPAMPGAGLCPGYTISRAILADAVALVRGDRFLTSEFTPYNLTSWGFQDCQADIQDGSYGGMLTRLLFRSLPEYYPAGSGLAHFPFMTPAAMKKELKDKAKEYQWERPKNPQRPPSLKNHAAVKKVLSHNGDFGPASKGFTALSKSASIDSTQALKKVFLSKDWLAKWANRVESITEDLIKQHHIVDVDDKEAHLNIVMHVINWVPVVLISKYIAGIPLKSKTNPNGKWNERELYDKFADISNYVMYDLEPQDDWKLCVNAKKAVTDLFEWIQGNCIKACGGELTFSKLISETVSTHIRSGRSDSSEFLSALLDAVDNDESKVGSVAFSILSFIIASAAPYSAALTHVVDYYLSEKPNGESPHSNNLANINSARDDAALVGYIREALRHVPTASAIYRTAKVDTVVDGIKVPANTRVFASLVDANAETGLAPEDVLYDLGEQGLLDSAFFEATAPRILRKIFALKNLRRNPGLSGKVAKFSQELHGVEQTLYLDIRSRVTPFPASLIVAYDSQ